MKRVIYISTLALPISDEEIETIGLISSRNNKLIDVTGVLISVHDYFFQILEGDEATLDVLVAKIRRDPRHRDLMILSAERDISERMFPHWNMQTIRLDAASDILLQAIRMMLQNIAQSHRIIERYTQPSVLKFLTEGINPLTVPVRKTEKIVIFSDIVGFSVLSDLFPVDEVAQVVNAYLDVCSTRIVAHGGEVAKYVGDCVIAYFAPEQMDDAVDACLAVLSSVEALRGGANPCRLMKFLHAGFGIAMGTVIEGNIGSSVKMDYTVLGNTVNMAARLESLTRQLGKAIAINETARQGMSGRWPVLCAGEFQIKGQEKAQRVFTIDDPRVDRFIDHHRLAEQARLAMIECQAAD